MKITVVYCKRCHAPMLPAEVLDNSPHLGGAVSPPRPERLHLSTVST